MTVVTGLPHEPLTADQWSHLDDLLDSALEASFPASDPIAIAVPPVSGLSTPSTAAQAADSRFSGIVEPPKDSG